MSRPTFRPLFWTQFFGAFNDNFFKNALIMWITFHPVGLTDRPAAEWVPLAGGLFILPYFLFSGTAGQVADRFDKARVIRIIKLIEIGLMTLALIGFAASQLPFLLVVLFGMGLHSTFFAPLKFSILPQHVPERDLVGANALVEAGTFVAILLGTIAGGLVMSLGPPGRLVTGVTACVVAVLGYVVSRRIPPAPAVDARLAVRWDPVRPTLDVLRYTIAHRDVFLMILGISWFWMFGAATLLLIPVYCKDVLYADETVVTLFLTCFSLGIAIGSLVCGRASRGRVDRGWVVLGALGISAWTGGLGLFGGGDIVNATGTPVSALGFLSTPQGTFIAIDLTLLAVFAGFFIVPLNTLVQERTQRHLVSRVIAGNNVLNAFFMVMASVLILGLSRAGFTVPHVFLILSALNVLAVSPVFGLDSSYLARFAKFVRGDRSSI